MKNVRFIGKFKHKQESAAGWTGNWRWDRRMCVLFPGSMRCQRSGMLQRDLKVDPERLFRSL